MTDSVFVTGSSSWSGKEVALRFAAEGFRVFTGGRKIEDTQPLMVHGGNIVPVILGLRNQEQIQEAAKFIDKECGAEPRKLAELLCVTAYGLQHRGRGGDDYLARMRAAIRVIHRSERFQSFTPNH